MKSVFTLIQEPLTVIIEEDRVRGFKVLQTLHAMRCWPLWIRLTIMGAALGVAYLCQNPLERN